MKHEGRTGCTKEDYSSTLWQNGSEWLTTPDKWPSFLNLQPSIPPLVVAAAVATEFIPTEPTPLDVGLHCVISVEGYSTLGKLLTVTVYMCFIFR